MCCTTADQTISTIKYYVIGVALLITHLCTTATAQDTIPVLKGTVDISVTKGTFTCDVTLENIPRIKDYFIRLNAGLNLLYFKNADNNNRIYYEKSFSDTLSSGESSAFYFSDNTGKAKFLPRRLRMRYTGMFPVSTDTVDNYSVVDWKGNIAFNGYSVRTDGRQSCWYPVLYDITRDEVLNKVKYDLQVNCADCSVIYLNGNLPVKANTAKLKSDIPVDISMYSGKFNLTNIDSTYFLNPDITAAQIKQFGDMTNTYKKFYEDNLHIPYKTAITYVQTTPTSKNNAWLFVSYPTIFNIGYGNYGMKGFFDTKTGNWFKPYIAHELGHYYFGTYKVFNAELGDMMNEGFPEYLSLQTAKKLVADSIYKKKISEKIAALKNFDAVPFARVASANDYKDRELYVYSYAPLVFTAIQKEIGEKRMWQWLNTLLTTPAERTNYQFLKETLGKTLQDKLLLDKISSKYFDSDNVLENVTAQVQ